MHYEALGFRVVRNTRLEGHQVDLLASKYISGASLFTLLIEVKSRTGSVVGINDVTPFLNTASALVLSGRVQAAVLVTDSEFSQDANGAAYGKPGIRLLTLRELEQDLFNYSESLLKTRYDYEASAIFAEYIPLGGKASELTINDAASYILDWSDSETTLLIVVGDFGSGKTTILERAFYEQAKKRLIDTTDRFPIFLRLRKLLQYSDLWDFVSYSLKENQNISPTRAYFERQLNAGELLVFLDGFDEIQTGASAKDRASFLRTLIPLLCSNSPCVLSTRPTYFESFTQMARSFVAGQPEPISFHRLSSNDRLDLDALLAKLRMNASERASSSQLRNVLRLSQLTDGQITEYLASFSGEIQQATGCTAEDAKKFLYRIYDLKDLMGRPLLLNMVVSTIIAGRVPLSAKQLTIGPSTLYDLYTQICAKRDIQKAVRGQSFDEESRLAAARAIALQMLDSGAIELSNLEVYKTVEAEYRLRVTDLEAESKSEFLDRAVTDIRVCSFLSFGSDGALRFAHKSYLEFFVAQALVVACQESIVALKTFSKRGLTREIIYFLGSFARDQESFGRMVVGVLKGSLGNERDALNLCARIAFSSGSRLGGLRLDDVSVEDVDLQVPTVHSVILNSVRLSAVSIQRTLASRWIAHDCELNDVRIVEVQFSSSEIVASMRRVEISSTTFTEVEITIRSDDSSVQNCMFSGCNLRFNGTFFFAAVVIRNCRTVEFEKSFRIAGKSSIRFENSLIVGHRTDPWYVDGTQLEFIDSVFSGVRLERADLLPGRRTGLPIRESRLLLKRCSGVVLSEGLAPEELHSLQKLYPKILVCNLEEISDALERRRSDALRKGHSGSGTKSTVLRAVTTFLKKNNLTNKVGGILAEVLQRPSRKKLSATQK